MKYNSPDEIRVTLGLKEWHTYRLDNIASILKGREIYGDKETLLAILNGRTSGRTTKMLIEALYMSQSHEVVIQAHCDDYANTLVSTARKYAEQLGLDPLKINPVSSKNSSDAYYCYDHYYPTSSK